MKGHRRKCRFQLRCSEDILEEVAVYLVCFFCSFFKPVRFVLVQTAVGSQRKHAGMNRPVSVGWVTRAKKMNGLKRAFGAQVWCFKCI